MDSGGCFKSPPVSGDREMRPPVSSSVRAALCGACAGPMGIVVRP